MRNFALRPTNGGCADYSERLTLAVDDKAPKRLRTGDDPVPLGDPPRVSPRVIETG